MKKFMKHEKLMASLLALVVFFITACGQGDRPGTAEEKSSQDEKKTAITIGGKDFTEQHILLKIASIYLKEKGYEVYEAGNMSSRVLRSALESGQIDLCWEYTGTALVVFHNQQAETDSELAYERVKEIDKRKSLVWLDKTEINSPYVVLMRQDKAEELGISSISGLADLVRQDKHQLLLATNVEFYGREDGLSGLQKRYRFEFPDKNVVKMDLELLYNVLKDDQADVSVGVGTDGRIMAFNLIALEDDQHFFPAYNAVPVVRKEYLEKNPKLAYLFNRLSERLDTHTMRQLNYLVDVEHEDVIEVVREWLSTNNLI